MTIQSEVSKAGPFTGNGTQTVFPFEFRVFTGTEVSVYIDSILQETGYSVALETIGGSVTLETPLATGSTLAIIRNVAFNQLTDLESGQAFFPDTLERAYDKLTMQTQQLKEGLSRAVIVPPDDNVTAPATLLLAIAEAQANAAASAAEAADSATDSADFATAATAAATDSADSATAAAVSATRAEALATTALRHMFEVFYTLTTETPPGAYPLHTGELIASCDQLFPTFWAKALELQTAGKIRTVSQATYDSEVSTYSETGAFVIDIAAKSIRLPKITRFLSSIDQLSDIGTPVGDAIRNITGAVALGSGMTTSGAFALGTLIRVGAWGDVYGDLFRGSFDASRVVPTADENRPKHVKGALYIQVYTAAIPASEAQAAQFVGSLVAKADRSAVPGLAMPNLFSTPTVPTVNVVTGPVVSDSFAHLTHTAAATLFIYSDSGGTTQVAAITIPANGNAICPLPQGVYYKVSAGTCNIYKCNGAS